ncbi:hypothetical protein DRO49_01965 [Candidatus Bathyarchaeota archaeon]|nr:MAG: hypothetical protein DRO49_01965 [Candidatus Bathyarchaeota archaeon]
MLARRRVIIDEEAPRRVRVIEEEASESLVYTIALTLLILIALSILEALYLLTFHQWSDSIFNGIMLVIGTVLGALWGRHG